LSLHDTYMKRCLKLAAKGIGVVAPNPLVGCVIVHKGKIIGEGYHEKFGGSHAEINAINSVKNKNLLKNSTLYVSLEPCAHHGKTPPCADAILKHGIKKVVIGCADPNPLVKGKGIAKLVKGGCDVITGIMEKECIYINRRFFTFQLEKRPYIILKWAMTRDGFIDKKRTKNDKPLKITGAKADRLSHKWRSEEQAIMVGTNTAIKDNPLLTTRKVKGKSPVRIVIDRNLKIPANSNIFSNFASVIVVNGKKNAKKGNVEYVNVGMIHESSLQDVLKELYNRNIQSVIVEGGAKLLNSFIKEGFWDEARVFSSGVEIGSGIKAPVLKGTITSPEGIHSDKIKVGVDTLNQYMRDKV
jgi:diaminohydroxyphosphoribosylaminopyrimidine deaminase / 5-amino-6-(5-phosphoribosylamino)uracil reductase